MSFTAEPGEIIALTGPSGAGKSTLARLLVRFYDPDSGTVQLDGHDLRDLRLVDVRHHVALLSQDALLLNTTVRDTSPTAASMLISNASSKRPKGQTPTNSSADSPMVTKAGSDIAADGSQVDNAGDPARRLGACPRRARHRFGRGILARLLDPLRRLVQGRTTIVISHNLLLAREADRI
ncbi:MAG: ATP-binding cassette domain-containing protein, partial [Actinomycetota bacterium]|nr:ATP-binding cassette domain-containing protein [Actinomycetota bacterium]